MKRSFMMFFLVGVLFLVGCSSTGEYDAFASCLTESGATFYGAYWCPHCKEQKGMFGNSIELVNYVECSLPDRGGQNEVCNAAEIQRYPTWEFGDGQRVEGVMGLGALASKSKCSLEG